MAAAALGDIAALGVSHLYLSPIAEAVPGSGHGYDVIDPTRVRAELGGEDGLLALLDACRAEGLGVVLDVVPNHLAAHPGNPWWWKVLRLGRHSRWAAMFDIDWEPPKPQLLETILVPVLADHYGRELEAGTIELERGSTEGHILTVRYHEHQFPLSPASTAHVLLAAARRADDDVLSVAARMLARVEQETDDLDARDTDLAVAERTVLSRLRVPEVSRALDEELASVRADADTLDALLEQQHYRLARWRVGASEVDYRRFFDVDTLVAVRTDRPEVFDLVHQLPLRLLPAGVDGLRIDHVDGLRDPARYVEELRSRAGAKAWLVVEKILAADEPLPPGWPIDGTTGYEVADLLGRWLTDPAGAEVLADAWRDWTGETRSYGEVERAARRHVLSTSLAADVERVTDAMVVLCERRRRHRDHPRVALRDAVIEVAAHAPAYRSYIRFEGNDPERPRLTEADERFVTTAVTNARDANPGMDPELFDLLAAVLLGRLRGAAEAEFTLRFQQLCAPAAAKGGEDTALYRWTPLPHRCEVGAEPSLATASADDWHRACIAASRRWPHRMTTLATHDTKRGADTRARLAAITTMPDTVLDSFKAWWAGGLTDAHPADGWTMFHTLVSAFPLSAERAWAVIEKSLREAKLRTSWTDPDVEYEERMRALVETSVGDAVIAAVATAASDAGWAAGLAQLALQLMAPGVPDIYQGGEGWDLALVDPDNRRAPDLDRLHHLATAAATRSFEDAWSDADARVEGIPRAVVLRTALGVRRRHASAFEGGYVPLATSGPDADRAIAFGRGDPPDAVVVACRPGQGARIEARVAIDLPPGRWLDLLTGAHRDGQLRLDDRPVPVAILERLDS